MRNAMQLKAQVRNLAKKSGASAEVLLRNFVMERFLERLAVSDYRHNFILKGGVLVASMIGIDARTTKDVDVVIKGQSVSESEVASIIKTIVNEPLADGVDFSYTGIEEIREEADYPGFRVTVVAAFDTIRQVLKIDISTGDFATPKEIEYRFQLMFEDRNISIMAYNPESVLAEKFETAIVRGTINTRMRDFYDMHVLSTIQAFEEDVFVAALQKTAANRKTRNQIAKAAEVVSLIEKSPEMQELWNRYQQRYSYAADVSWVDVIAALRVLAVLWSPTASEGSN